MVPPADGQGPGPPIRWDEETRHETPRSDARPGTGPAAGTGRPRHHARPGRDPSRRLVHLHPSRAGPDPRHLAAAGPGHIPGAIEPGSVHRDRDVLLRYADLLLLRELSLGFQWRLGDWPCVRAGLPGCHPAGLPVDHDL